MIEGAAGARRILKGIREPLEVELLVDGKPTDADGVVTVTVLRGDGTAVATAATTTKPAGTTGRYQWLPGAPEVAEVERYTATWAATVATIAQSFTTTHEVVGGFYVDLASLARIEGLDTTEDRDLLEARRRFEDLAEQHCDVAFVPRYAIEDLPGCGCRSLTLQDNLPVRKLLGVKIDGTVKVLSEFEVTPSGRLTWDEGVFPTSSRVLVSYEHGRDQPDAELRGAALKAITHWVLGEASSIPENATSFQSDVGSFSLSLAGNDRPTGIPTVDAVLNARRTGDVLVG